MLTTGFPQTKCVPTRTPLGDQPKAAFVLNIILFYRKDIEVKAYRIKLIFASVFLCSSVALISPQQTSAQSQPRTDQESHTVALLDVTTCANPDGTLKMEGTARSWRQDESGKSDSVTINRRVIYDNRRVEYGYVTNSHFGSDNGYQFGFGYDGIPSNAVTVTAISETVFVLSDGRVINAVNEANARFVGNCPPLFPSTATATATPTVKGSETEPSTATATPTPTNTGTATETSTATATKTSTSTATATGTSTPTATATVTSTPTKTPTPKPTVDAWDKSSLSVIGICEDGIPTFFVKNFGQEMRNPSLWTLYINGDIFEQGFIKLSAGGNTQKPFPGHTGQLRFTIEQAAGHPGESLAQATIDTALCAEPTNSDETAEPLDITIHEVAEESSPTTGVYYIECLPASPSNGYILVEIFVTFTSAPGETRKGYYCGKKIYIDGSVVDATIVGAVADAQNAFPTPEAMTSSLIYLPVIVR